MTLRYAPKATFDFNWRFSLLSRDDVRKRSVRESLSHATIRRVKPRLFHYSTNPILYQSDSSFNRLLSYGFAGGRGLFEKYGRCGFFLLAPRVRALLANAGVRTLDGMYVCRGLESRGSQAHRARPRGFTHPYMTHVLLAVWESQAHLGRRPGL
jgi:hypothetical protein